MTEISKEYGTALFMLAAEEGETRNFASALEQIREVFIANPQYVELLASPSISLRERLDAIDAAFSDVIPEYVLSFLKLLCENREIATLYECIDEFFLLITELENRCVAKIYYAFELTEGQKEKLLPLRKELFVVLLYGCMPSAKEPKVRFTTPSG